jgi:hypothetical protein
MSSWKGESMMRNGALLSLMLSLVACSTNTVAEMRFDDVDMTGRWRLVIQSPQKADPDVSVIELLQTGSDIQGHFCTQGICDGDEIAGSVVGTTLDAETLNFEVHAEVDVDGETFSGVFEAKDPMCEVCSATVVGTRENADGGI